MKNVLDHLSCSFLLCSWTSLSCLLSVSFSPCWLFWLLLILLLPPCFQCTTKPFYHFSSKYKNQLYCHDYRYMFPWFWFVGFSKIYPSKLKKNTRWDTKPRLFCGVETHAKWKHLCRKWKSILTMNSFQCFASYPQPPVQSHLHGIESITAPHYDFYGRKSLHCIHGGIFKHLE